MITTSNTVPVESIASAVIKAQAKIDGIDTVTILGDNGKTGDTRVIVYQFGDVRVASTNGDPVWEESAPDDFAALIAAENINLDQLKMSALTELFQVADRINKFGKQFCGRHYSTGAKAWKFNPDCALAGVYACLCDDEGSIDETQAPIGAVTLRLDIEFFRLDKTPHNGEQAETEVIGFAESLGFTAKPCGDGSGEFGEIHCYILEASK